MMNGLQAIVRENVKGKSSPDRLRCSKLSVCQDDSEGEVSRLRKVCVQVVEINVVERALCSSPARSDVK